MRAKLRERAAALSANPEEQEGELAKMELGINRLNKKIHKGYFKTMEPKRQFQDFEEDTPIPCRKRRRTRGCSTQ